MEPYINEKHGLTNVKYIMYFLLSDFGQHEIFKNMKATAQPSLSMETIRDIVIPIPEISEQEEIVNTLDVLLDKEDQNKRNVEMILEQIEKIKKSILAKAFRGELGMNNPKEENATELLCQMLDD